MKGEIDKNRIITWLKAEFGLLDAHAELNKGPYLKTYQHCAQRIDHIYISNRLLIENLVLQITIREFDSFFTSDQQPVLININAET